MRSGIACLCWLFLWVAQVSAQSVTVTGVVRDRNTLAKIRGVNIIVRGTHLGTSSDYAGRFTLSIPASAPKAVVEFRHVGYDVRAIPLDSLRSLKTVYLQPRIIQLPGVAIEERGAGKLEIERDLPQTVNVLQARDFEIRGYVDAGDLLRVDHSVQIDEQLSGKKFVTIRGGNADDVVVMYNGVKLNNAYDNRYDLSLIELNDIDRLEVIKGSNTALYGPEAFSGVINIVPKLQQDYTIRFQQRLGTYRSGNWGVQLYKKFGRLHTSYSFQRGGTERTFLDTPQEDANLSNRSLTHNANVSYSLKQRPDGSVQNAIDLMWLYTSLDYKNGRDNEVLNNFNHLVSGRYRGNLGPVQDLELSLSWKQLEEDQFLAFTRDGLSGSVARGIRDRSAFVNVRKGFRWNRTNLLMGYQFRKAKLVDEREEKLNFGGAQTFPLSQDLQRLHHGVVAIAKYRGEAGNDFLHDVNVDVSVRHDRVRDSQENVVLPSGFQGNVPELKNAWEETVGKFSISLEGYRSDLLVNAFLNYGKNVKFPTLFQQVSTVGGSGLQPEGNNSFELGVLVSREIRNHPTLYGWQLSGNYFQNDYDNKLVEARNIFGGRSEFTSVQTARISGFEGKAALFLFRKKVKVEMGVSRYFISDKAAFPFKSDFKRTLTFSIDHAGYALQVFAFKEGEQVGLLLDQSREPVEVLLPDYVNMDVHLSKTFEIGKFKIFGNFSARNVLKDDDFQLQGLTIRDRRFYVTFGAQY